MNNMNLLRVFQNDEAENSHVLLNSFYCLKNAFLNHSNKSESFQEELIHEMILLRTNIHY